MRKYVRISHVITSKMPIGSKTATALNVSPHERLAQGDHSNSSYVTLYNHCGTHIDAPGHMCGGRNFLADLPIEDFVFTKPHIIDVPTSDCGTITSSQIESEATFLSQCDLLLIRTGFSRIRSEDMDRYTWNTPGISVEAARYLVENFPNIRSIGVDFLSFERLDDQSHNFAAHKIVFEHNIFILEDLDLEGIENRHLRRIFAFPLFIEGVDSFHATIVAEMRATTC